MQKPILGCDAHKRYSVFVRLREDGKTDPPVRVEHDGGKFRTYLDSLAESSDIAIESTGHWYWLVDEIEKAGHHPHLTQPFTAKRMMGHTHKTDPLDAKGLAILLRTGTLPEVWIPPRDLRDLREILRTRMALRDLRTMLKHRIHSALERYGIFHTGITDLFGKRGRDFLAETAAHHLPPHTAAMVAVQLDAFDELSTHIEKLETRIRELITPDPAVKRLQSAPGIGEILGPVIALEIGDIARFPRAEDLVGYCGLVPRVFSSGGKTTHGRSSRRVNLYLKWAFVEAAQCAAHVGRKNGLYRHVHDLYRRHMQNGKGHGRAAVAVARHLAEAAFWMLRKQQNYRPPQPPRQPPTTPPQACPSSSASEAALAPPVSTRTVASRKASRASSTNGSARDTSGN